MSQPLRTYQLSFRLEHLERVMSGEKTCTIRVSKQTQHIEQGAALYLCFGRRDRPTLLEAQAVRVERFDLSAEVEWWSGRAQDILEVPLSIASSTMEPPLAASEDEIPQALREALRDSGGHLDDLIDEMLERQQHIVTCIWWWSPAA